MGSSRNNGDQPQEQQQIDTGAQDQSNQFGQMMAQQQRARMEQIGRRQQRQGIMAQNFGGMPNMQSYQDQLRGEFMGLLAQLGQPSQAGNPNPDPGARATGWNGYGGGDGA